MRETASRSEAFRPVSASGAVGYPGSSGTGTQAFRREQSSLRLRIANKHASLGICPDQYQLVRDNLMWVIGDVLGDAVTPDVAATWDEVYWLMADALMNQERA